MLQEINKNLLQYLNSFAENPVIEKMVILFVDAPIFFLPIFLLGYWIYYTFNKKKNNKKRKEKLIFIFYSVVLAIGISLLIQQFVDIARPESVLHNSGKLLLKHLPDASFPSDHATVSFAFLTSLFFTSYKKIGYIFLVFILLMNLSRVIAGVHWPVDIIAGAFVGIGSSFFTFKILTQLEFVKKLNIFIIKITSYFKL